MLRRKNKKVKKRQWKSSGIHPRKRSSIIEYSTNTSKKIWNWSRKRIKRRMSIRIKYRQRKGKMLRKIWTSIEFRTNKENRPNTKEISKLIKEMRDLIHKIDPELFKALTVKNNFAPKEQDQLLKYQARELEAIRIS